MSGNSLYQGEAEVFLRANVIILLELPCVITNYAEVSCVTLFVSNSLRGSIA